MKSIYIGVIFIIIWSACSAEKPSPTIAKSYSVVFSVAGTAPKAVIGFRCDNTGKDIVSEVFDVPWERKFTCRPGPGSNLTLSATHRVDSPGSLECEIWVDGELKDSDYLSHMKDGLSIVSCSVFP